MAIQKTGGAGPKLPTQKPKLSQRVLKQHEDLVLKLAQAMDPGSDGGVIITRPELARLRKGLDRAKNISPDQRAQIEQTLEQADTALKVNEVIVQVKQALDSGGQDGKTVNVAEAAAIIQQAQDLPEVALKDLKAQVLHALTAQDHWDITPDARQAFASFLDVAVDKLPAPKAARAERTAAFTKARNEAGPQRIDRAEFKEIMQGINSEDMPPELREMALASVLGAHKEGRIKLDPQSRKVLTRSVATGFANGPDQALAQREYSSLMPSTQGSYASSYMAEVIASGGSFEEILFAFMLLMSEKAEDEAKSAMEDLARMEGAGGDRSTPRTDKTDSGAVESGEDAGDSQVTGDATTSPAARPSDGDIKKAAKVLESMVQSAHHATTEKSDGGAQITSKESKKLVSYLKRLPENVQTMLAGSIEKALQAGGVPLTGNAHMAIDGWAQGVLGRPLDITNSSEPGKPMPFNSELAKVLRASDKLEDKVASFIIDTMYKPDLSLKEKMKPFKALRHDMAAGTSAEQRVRPSVGEAVKRAHDITPELLEAANKKTEAAHPASDDFNLQMPTSEFSSSLVPQIDANSGPNKGGGSKIQAQQRLQMAMNNRQRVLDMMSNIMKAIHDTQMTAIRNLR